MEVAYRQHLISMDGRNSEVIELRERVLSRSAELKPSRPD